MSLLLYTRQGDVRIKIQPSDNDRADRSLMGDSTLSLSFELYEYIQLEVGDYVDFDGERYTLLEAYRPEKRSTVQYVYNVKLYGVESVLRNAIVLKPAQTTAELTFAYDATAAEHIKLIVDNINRITGVKDWTVGTVTLTGNKNIDYSNRNCFDALTEIARVFETEWWIEGHTVNLSRCEYGTPVTLGYRNGLTSLARVENDTVKPFTRLYPIGSTRNIDRTKYGHTRLHMPVGREYLERNTQLGIIERSEETAFAQIYPRYTGKVTSVRTEDRTGDDGKKFTVYFISDSNIPFDPNAYEIAGLHKHVVFVSGELNGRDFEVNYKTKDKEFEIITQYPYDNQQLPGRTLIPKSGDDYIPYNFRMPDDYVKLAEKELEVAAEAYLKKISEDTSVYKASTDYIDITSRNIDLKIGRRVLLRDTDLFAATNGEHATRITRVSRRINNPPDADIEFCYAVDRGRITNIESNIANIESAYKTTLENVITTILKSWDSADPTEYNVLSALRTIETIRKTALRKDAIDTTNYPIYSGSTIGSKEHVPGVVGWLVDQLGDANFRNVKVAGSIQADEFRKNRITIVEGEHYFSSGVGIVKAVDSKSLTFTLVLEDGDITSLQVGDRCKGLWTSPTGVEVCKFEVRKITADVITYALAAGTSNHPHPGMHLATVGHPTDKNRQRATIIRKNVILQYKDVTGWDVLPKNISGLFGDLDGFSIEPFGALTGSGVMFDNAYIRGVLQQRSFDGKSLSTVHFDKGPWRENESEAFYYDQYSHAGHNWLWTSQSPTRITPAASAAGWVDKGLTAEEAKRLAEDKVDNLQIGGENYVIDAAQELYNSKPVSGGGGYVVYNTHLTANDVRVGDKFRLSFDVFVGKENVELLTYNQNYNTYYNNQTIPIAQANAWVHLSVNKVISAVGDKPVRCEFWLTDANNATGTLLKIRNVQLERGDKETSFRESQLDIKANIASAKKAGTDAASAVNDLSNNVNNFKNEVNTSFKDGLISESEAKAIEKYINVIKADRQNAEATYAKVATSTYLEGQAKTDLLNAKISYFGAVDNLLSAVNTAIADGKTTVAEKQDVDAKYELYRTAFALFSGALENANKAIQDKIKALSDAAIGSIAVATDNILNSGDNMVDKTVWFCESKTSVKQEGDTFIVSKTADAGDGAWGIYQEIAVEPDAEYILTIAINNAKSSNRSGFGVGGFLPSDPSNWNSLSGNSYIININSNPYKQHVFKTRPGDTKARIYLCGVSVSGVQCAYKWVTLKKGNNASLSFSKSNLDVERYAKLAVRPNLVKQSFIGNADDFYIPNEVDILKKHPARSVISFKDIPPLSSKLKALVLSVDINVTKVADESNTFARSVYFAVRSGETHVKFAKSSIPKEVKKDRYIVVLPCTIADINACDHILCWLTDYGAGYINKTIENVKIEQVLDGEPEIPTTYIPHPDDLKGAPGLDAVTSTVFFDGTYRNAYTTGVYANVRIYHKGEDVTSKADVKAFYEGIGNGATAFTTPSKIREEFENRKRDGSDLHVWGTATYLGQTSYFDRRLRNISDGDKGNPGENGHSLTASSWFTGDYTDGVTTNVEAHAKLYYDGVEVTSGFDESVKNRYGFGSFTNEESSRINSGVFANIARDGKPLLYEFNFLYKGLRATSMCKIDNNRKGDQGVAGWDGFSMPSEWDSTLAYPRTAVVWVKSGSDESNYQAKKDVPKGTPVSNTEFWQPINGFKASVFTEIWAKKLTVDAANIKNLTVNMIKAGKFDKSSFEVLPNGNIKIGQMLLNDAGELVGYDAAGKVRMFINSRNISEIDNIAANSSYNKTFTASSGMYNAVGASGVPDRLTSFYIDTDMVDLHISGSITVRKERSEVGEAQLNLYLKSILYNVEYNLGTCISLSTSNTLEIDKTLPSCGHGNYELVAIWTYQANGGSSISTMSGEVNNITINATKVTDLAQVVMGVDGFMAVRDGDNYFHYSRGNGLTVKGKSNIPGILAAGTVLRDGYVVTEDAYGAYVGYGSPYPSGRADSHGSGKYTVYHSIGHTDYTVQLTAEALTWGGNKEPIIISWYNKTANSFQVVQSAHGGNSTNERFSYVIFGKNKG